MTPEKHPLETVREFFNACIDASWGGRKVPVHRFTEAITALTTYMGQTQSCAECERLGRENARLREAVGDLVDRAYILKAHPAVVAAMSSAEDE